MIYHDLDLDIFHWRELADASAMKLRAVVAEHHDPRALV
jgi:hypothetical protein